MGSLPWDWGSSEVVQASYGHYVWKCSTVHENNPAGPLSEALNLNGLVHQVLKYIWTQSDNQLYDNSSTREKIYICVYIYRGSKRNDLTTIPQVQKWRFSFPLLNLSSVATDHHLLLLLR